MNGKKQFTVEKKNTGIKVNCFRDMDGEDYIAVMNDGAMWTSVPLKVAKEAIDGFEKGEVNNIKISKTRSKKR